ncbi:AraC family transcriptional regulator [Salipiger mucosus]|uniref:AraC family transcriptional regulator n=1 Tax=Salipiger mucosus TaxID=263378 RepID=UPI00036FD701|nr:AraC family transcriptional regulator [Salipiger mucosus]
MAQFNPTHFWPREAGRGTSVTLPGQPRSPLVDVVCISEGMTIARSRFSPDQDHNDDIQRPPGQLLLAFNLTGEMTIRTPDAEHVISRGAGWAIRPGEAAFRRIVPKGTACANIVLSLTLAALPDHLRSALQRAFPRSGVFHRLGLPVPGRADLATLFDGLDTPSALIRKEGQCLALIGHALEELDKDAPKVRGGADPKLLVARARSILAERLGERIVLSDLARSLGVSHVTLNRAFRLETGRSVFEHLRAMRLEKAAHLIGETDRSLIKIAFECGFSSPSHLSKAWRDLHGASPRAWRKSRQSGQLS